MDRYCVDPYHAYAPFSQYRQAPIQYQNYSPYYYVPVQPQSARRAPQRVSIPVQYAAPESRRSDPRSDAALKIQKALRGFLVRKSVRKIAGIKHNVDEISERVSKKETAELVRSDAKERLKVVETLMSLLLKLDSVKGVDFGVRELRRSVIKKAIALQEKVEASAANHQTDGGHEAAEPATYSSLESAEQSAEANDQTRDGHESAGPETDSGLKSEEQSGERGVSERVTCCNKEEMLEKMVKENQRMVGLVTELVHRNEKQTRLLGSLSQRVELLERALVNERLRRKKRRQSLDCREEFF